MAVASAVVCTTCIYTVPQKIQPIRMQENRCIFVGIPPNLPIVHHIDYVMPCIMTWCKIVIVTCIFFFFFFAYEENTSDLWDIPRCTTGKHCITSLSHVEGRDLSLSLSRDHFDLHHVLSG